MRTRPLLAALAGIPLVLTALLPAAPALAAPYPVQVILDGRSLALNPAPRIVNDRTLVPLRGLFEAMGAELTWHNDTQTIELVRGDRYVRVKIDRRLACFDRDCVRSATLDVPPQLIGDRTYVPVRFLSTALGVKVSWDNDRWAVLVESDKVGTPEVSPITLPTLVSGQTIQGPIQLKAAGPAGSSVQFFLIDPATGSGHLIGAGTDPTIAYTFTPDPVETGARLVVAAVTNAAGVTLYSNPVRVLMDPRPIVRATGADWNGLVDGPITFGSDVNFVSTHAEINLVDPVTGAAERLATTGPGEQMTWYPQVGHNGTKHLQATAYDRNGKAYPSEVIPIKVNVSHRTLLSGIQDGAVLTRSVTLRAPTNYPAESVKYVANGKVLGWGYSFAWNFGPEANGTYNVHAEVVGADGVTRSTAPAVVTINAKPQVWPSGIGPKQVVTGLVTLRATSNVPLTSVKYYLTDALGATEVLGTKALGESLTWTPTTGKDGNRTLRVEAKTAAGQMIYGDPIDFRIFTGKLYGPEPIVAKSEFLGFASGLARPAYRLTGMSAALQVAQAILETGWGQAHPVDKYTGQVSNNLFGIKGRTTSAGSVISNTWEEYNGVAYRIDAEFRAYRNVSEGWRDHKDLLLTKPWYAPFRAVITDPVQGAWALRKSGYATDSQYPVKLINIMKANDLFKLDQFEF